MTISVFSVSRFHGGTHGIGAGIVIFSRELWRLTKGGIQNIIKSNEYRDFYVLLPIALLSKAKKPAFPRNQ